MKQKATASQTLTKQDLIDTLKEFREELMINIDSRFEKFEKSVNTTMDIGFDEMELRIEDRARERHSEVLTRFDGWAGELETAREDRVITTKQLKDHDKRIKKLEKIQN